MDVKDGEISNENKERTITNWRKCDPCYKVAENFAELWSSLFWKVDFGSDKTGYLAEEILKRSVEGTACFPLTAYSKKR